MRRAASKSGKEVLEISISYTRSTNPSFPLFQLHLAVQLLDELFKMFTAAVAIKAAPLISAFSSKSNFGW